MRDWEDLLAGDIDVEQGDVDSFPFGSGKCLRQPGERSEDNTAKRLQHVFDQYRHEHLVLDHQHALAAQSGMPHGVVAGAGTRLSKPPESGARTIARTPPGRNST